MAPLFVRATFPGTQLCHCLNLYLEQVTVYTVRKRQTHPKVYVFLCCCLYPPPLFVSKVWGVLGNAFFWDALRGEVVLKRKKGGVDRRSQRNITRFYFFLIPTPLSFISCPIHFFFLAHREAQKVYCISSILKKKPQSSAQITVSRCMNSQVRAGSPSWATTLIFLMICSQHFPKCKPHFCCFCFLWEYNSRLSAVFVEEFLHPDADGRVIKYQLAVPLLASSCRPGPTLRSKESCVDIMWKDKDVYIHRQSQVKSSQVYLPFSVQWHPKGILSCSQPSPKWKS